MWNGKDMNELLPKGTKTGLCDSNGTEIKIGDRIRKEVTCNDDFHGAWSIYLVNAQGITPVLSYEQSEKGELLPKGYLACLLADEYDRKHFVFAINSKTLRPSEGKIEVIP